MASIYDLKPKFQTLLRPLVRTLAGAGVTANQITVAALLLSCLAGSMIALNPQERWPLLLVPVVSFLRMALNAIDGMLAREHDMKSPFGAILNELGDVLSDIALYLPFSLIAGVSAGWVVIVVMLAVVSELAGVIAVEIGAQRRYDGPMGKSDRAFVFGLIGLALGLGARPEPWVNFFLMITVGLLVITVANRARRALEEAK